MREEIERRAQELGLQPLRWPEPFPFDSSLAMRVATYAKSIGRTVPFAQAAFRQAFAGGRSLDDADSVVIAAAACEMHPAAVLRAAEMRSVAEQLAAATELAADEGVRDVPAVQVGERVFHGERALGEAAAALRSQPPSHREARDQGPPQPMRAKDAYRLIVTRGGRAPALLADPNRVDHIEVVEIESGEAIMLLDRPPHAASKLARAMRSDLNSLDAEEFRARWGTVES